MFFSMRESDSVPDSWYSKDVSAVSVLWERSPNLDGCSDTVESQRREGLVSYSG